MEGKNSERASEHGGPSSKPGEFFSPPLAKRIERERERNDANVRERITDERKSGSLFLARGWGEVSIKRVFHHQRQSGGEKVRGGNNRAINPLSLSRTLAALLPHSDRFFSSG